MSPCAGWVAGYIATNCDPLSQRCGYPLHCFSQGFLLSASALSSDKKTNEVSNMNARHFSSVVFFAGSVLLPASLFAQAHDASVANHEPHHYDITDWDIEPEAVNYAEHIAPILQRSFQYSVTGRAAVGPCPSPAMKKFAPGHRSLCTGRQSVIAWAPCRPGMLRKTSGSLMALRVTIRCQISTWP